MAKPERYHVTVNRPVEAARATLRPGPRYTLKKAVLDAIKKNDADAIATEVALKE